MRIVSLVPNATEILFAIGAGDRLVGRSHECDFPPAALHLPVLTGSALRPGLTAAAVDTAVSAQLRAGGSLYTLDEARIAALAPDLIFTQELCPVCAVSTAQVEGALTPLAHCPEVVSLDPKHLSDVFADILRTGEAIGRRAAAQRLVDGLLARLTAVKQRTEGKARPRVLALEWLDPPFLAGHWVPEMIAAGGGEDCAAQAGDPSRRATWKEISELDPDWIIAMPCGFDQAGAQAQVAQIHDLPEWTSLRAVQTGQVAPVDANGLFSRPGPRLVDGIEYLASILHQTLE